jgi:serine/threonine protein phosphatase PrpC
LNFKVHGQSDVGKKRQNNEDNFGIDKELGLFIVADGMGGHAAGEVASRMAIELVMDYIRRTVGSDEPYLTGFNTKYSRAGNRLCSAVILANQVISDSAASRPEWQGMGTTLVAAWLGDPDHSRLSIAHVGDSRAYLLRHGQFRQLTTDHSLVEEQIKEGLLTREEAQNSLNRNMITRALGYRERVVPDIIEPKLEPGDKLLLCSDGLTTMLSDQEIQQIVMLNANLATASRQLINGANDKGGRDNITLIMASFL